MRLITCILGLGAGALLASRSCGQAPPAEIVFGMSTALSGPAADLGINMRDGVLAALEEANRAGGINGRKLRLIALDDGYEPSRTGPNMQTLVDRGEVVAIVGNVGTPTAVAALPIAESGHMPFYGAFTGAGILRRTPPDHYVVNYRASYAEETGAMVDALIDVAGLGVADIAFFTQRDAYGDAGYAGGIEALKRHGLKDEHGVAHGRYERNTVVVENGLADIMQAEHPARAVIMVGAYAPCARFIRLAKETGLEAIFLNVSFVGTASLAKALGSAGDGVVVTQVVPHYTSDVKIVEDYRKALRSYNTTLQSDLGSLEGYASTRVLLQALTALRGPVDRESVIRALEGLGKFDIGLGVPLLLDGSHHQACHQVWPTVLRNGKPVAMEWRELARK